MLNRMGSAYDGLKVTLGENNDGTKFLTESFTGLLIFLDKGAQGLGMAADDARELAKEIPLLDMELTNLSNNSAINWFRNLAREEAKLKDVTEEVAWSAKQLADRWEELAQIEKTRDLGKFADDTQALIDVNEKLAKSLETHIRKTTKKDRSTDPSNGYVQKEDTRVSQPISSQRNCYRRKAVWLNRLRI